MATRTNEIATKKKQSDSEAFGRILANPDPGEEVVITGVAGRYPESKNVHDLRDNLFNKVDMVTDNEKRWKRGHPEIPQRTGKIPNVEKCDSGYFGLHHVQATQMNPGYRVLFEVITEAIMDAGLHPRELEGTRTGLFVGNCFSETQKTWFHEYLIPKGFAITGNQRCTTTNLISHQLRLKGPSVICDTACSSSIYAFEHAYKAIRLGQCETAIVAGVNLCLHPNSSLQFARMGACSLEGICRVFDNKGRGYVRSEAVCAVVLQKSKVARRCYSTLLHAKTNCDGYKDSGLTFPSKELQEQLLLEFYLECDYVKPTQLSFLEAHGTGTKVGDPEELNAIDSVFTKGRQTPLLIGSIKSNLGHAEPASGLISITKILIAYETGYIAPNIYYTKPRAGAKSLEEGRLKVVTEKTHLRENDALCGVSGFGFGGSNCHVLLKRHIKNKNGQPDNILRLVCVSGRNRKATDSILDGVLVNNGDVEHIGLLQEVFKLYFDNHPYRAYSLIRSSDEISRAHQLVKNVKPKNLLICFGTVESDLNQHLDEIIQIPIINETLQSINNVLKSKGIDLAMILEPSSDQKILTKILRSFALQMTLTILIKACCIVPKKTYSSLKGYSMGPLVCAYFCERLSLKETTLCVYQIATTVHSATHNVSSVPSDIADLLRSNTEISNRLKDDLMNIFKSSRGMDNITSEIRSLCNTFFLDNSNVAEFKAISKDDWYVLEVGNGDLTLTLPINESKTFKCYGSLDNILNSIGRLYLIGFSPQIQNLYPKIKFPVSRGTPMISPFIEWNHKRDWWVISLKENDDTVVEEKQFQINIDDSEYAYMTGHVIDGRTLIPAIGYLHMVWGTLSHILNIIPSMMTVVFENCKFKRATAIANNIGPNFKVSIQKVTGRFEVTEGDVLVASGRVYLVPNTESILDKPNKDLKIFEDQFPDMTTKEIYKELNLRGYNYSGKFRALQSYNRHTQQGKVLWDDNWVTFIDNMLQMMILIQDSRSLQIPISIKRLVIDAKRHLDIVNRTSDKQFDIRMCKSTGIIRAGYVEVKGVIASSIGKRKNQVTPILEKHVFVPNVTRMTIQEATRVDIQILVENFMNINLKIVEVIDEATAIDSQPLGDIIYNVLEDLPMIQPDITILSKEHLEVKNVKVEDKKLLSETKCALVVGSKLLQRTNMLQVAFSSIETDGFIVSREDSNFQFDFELRKKIVVVTIFSTNLETLVLFQKRKPLPQKYAVVKLSASDQGFSWLSELQYITTKKDQVIVLAQDEPLSGILGLINCLRKEPNGEKVKLIYTLGNAPEFNFTLPFYQNQLEKNLAVNIYKTDQWGTYRHLLINQNLRVEAEHSYMRFLRKGDLSSVAWLEGHLSTAALPNPADPVPTFVDIYYASVNFKDVMTATAKINAEDFVTDRLKQASASEGFEYSGVTKGGQRVIGMLTGGAFATMVEADKNILWKIPNNWNLEEAATVPVVYITVILGLIDRAKIRKNETVLIHSGTGGVGLAAIHIALHCGCTIYTTVGTPKKRQFLKERFPQLKDNHISNSRSKDFEQDIMKWTQGKGVDVILNSLAEEKLLASARCLARGGRFIEIGKYDMSKDNDLGLLLLEKNASYCGVMADALESKTFVVSEIFQNLIDCGAVVPLPRTVFNIDEVETAFRYMTTGKHIGKVLIEIRKEGIDHVKTIPCIPRYYCHPEKSYVICGGLGGFGLELADWLVVRNCRKLILVTRSGVKTGYQADRITIWESYGCTVQIATDDITTEAGCVNLITEANALGPVHGIFNLAAVLRDSVFENQTIETFITSLGPKAKATQHLDVISRLKCPQLRHFVVFSSVSCGRGNAGQTNYGMANSIMERICEKRREEGYPAVAIQWGAVGDVGLVADMQEDLREIAIGGTLQQKVSNCLEILDILLKQNEAPVVSSIVVAEKESKFGSLDSIVDVVASILGIKDIKTISLEATLGEIGMDSMTGVEIKQSLEREFEIFLTSQDIKAMTFSKLIDMQAGRDANKEKQDTDVPILNQSDVLVVLDTLLHFVPKRIENLVLTIEPKLIMKDFENLVILLPGIDGQLSAMEPLSKHLAAHMIGIQFTDTQQKTSIVEMTSILFPLVLEKVSRDRPFNIIAHSFGCAIALEIVNQLEQKGYQGKIALIDGSPAVLKTLTSTLENHDDNMVQIILINRILSLAYSVKVFEKEAETLRQCPDIASKLEHLRKLPVLQDLPDESINLIGHIYNKIKAVIAWRPNYELKSKIQLFKPSEESVKVSNELESLTSLCREPVEAQVFDGNHTTILLNEKLGQAINEYFSLL